MPVDKEGGYYWEEVAIPLKGWRGEAPTKKREKGSEQRGRET